MCARVLPRRLVSAIFKTLDAKRGTRGVELSVSGRRCFFASAVRCHADGPDRTAFQGLELWFAPPHAHTADKHARARR